MQTISLISTIRRWFAGRNAAADQKHITSPTDYPKSWAAKYPIQIRVPYDQDRFLWETRFFLEEAGVRYARITQSRNPDALYLFRDERAASILRHHLREINVQERPVGDWWTALKSSWATS